MRSWSGRPPRPLGLEHIVSSPFARAIQSIEPLARSLGIPIEIDPRLAERVLSAEPLPNWPESLRATFDDPELSFPGGESGRAATERAMAAAHDALSSGRTTALVSHGNLVTLLLRHVDSRIGFDAWSRLTNPDIFRVTLEVTSVSVERVWRA